MTIRGVEPKSNEFRLTVIGSGTCVPSARRGSPGLLIRTQECSFLVDCGPGTLGRLAKIGIGPERIDALFQTHIHPDHISDLVPFLFANNYGQPVRTADLNIFGAPGLGEFIGKLQGIYENWLDAQNYKLNVREPAGGPVELQGVRIKSSPVKHSKSSLAYRFTDREGKSIVVSGDTDYCRELVSLARGADLLVLECSHPDALKMEGHLSPRYAGRIAWEAECNKLVLTHFYPPCDDADIIDECRKEYSGEIFLAEDLQEYII